MLLKQEIFTAVHFVNSIRHIPPCLSQQHQEEGRRISRNKKGEAFSSKFQSKFMLRRSCTWGCSGVGGTPSAAISKRLSQSQDEAATTMSPLEVLFQPFRSTTQEKYLLQEFYYMSSNVVVFSSFRGCRKSTTVERLSKRLKYRHIGMGLWPWIMQVEHVCDYESYEKFVAKSKEPFLFSLLRKAIQYVANLILVAACSVPFYIASVWHEKCISLREDLLAFALMLFVAGCLTFTKKVVVVDDLLNFKFPGKGNDMAYNVLCELDRLKSRANAGNRIAIVSSNEGICKLFSDTNPSTYMAATFPKASDDELVQALQRCRLGTTSAEFEHAKELYRGIPHHLYSTCWWLIVAKHIRQIPRTVLVTVALELDLQCQAVARHYALAYSQEVDVATALTNLFTEAEVDDIVRIYGPRGPRRLVLTAGLLVTGEDARLQGELSLQDGTIANLQKQFKMQPDAANQEALKEEEAKLQHLKRYIEQRHAVKVYEPAVARAEAGFGIDVHTAIETGTDTFKTDRKCREEIGRIKRLLI